MPDWTEHLRPRLARLHLAPEREREIVEELCQHLDERYDELRSAGTDETEALRLAVEELLDFDALRKNMEHLGQAQVPRPITPGALKASIIGDLWQDLRYTARIFRKQSGFAALAILTLALGIGANSAMFALVDATLLRPLPFREPDRLVMLWERDARSTHSRVAPLNLRDWDERNRSFDRIAGCVPEAGSMVMAGADGTPDTVSRQWVTSGFFEVLGVKAIVGRTFLGSDNGRSVVVLSEGIWRSRFNADPEVVGRDIRLDGTPYTVVGVVPKEFRLLGRTSLWAMVSMQGAPPIARSLYVLQAIGRLKHDVAQETAEADMAAVAEGLARDFPKTNTARGVTIEPLHGALIGSEVRLSSMLFLGVVAFVLVICCANVANLLLARGTGRARELAIRAALGAGHRRIVRLVLTESALLSIIGGAVGLAVGAAILNVAPSLIPEGLFPSAVTLSFNWHVVAFCGVTTLLVGILFGTVPAWQAMELSSPQMISAESRTVVGGGGRIRGLLVVAEVATAVLLLFGAGLLMRTLIAVDHVDRGYGADNVLTMMVDPLASRYPTASALRQFYAAVEQEIRAIPGVDSTAWASTLPLGTSSAGRSFFEIVGEPAVEESERPTADYQIVSPTYFHTLDIPVLAGRAFDSHDTAESAVVCIVNEAFVRRHLHGQSPIGVRITTRPTSSAQAKPVVRQIVGVVRQVKGTPDETEDLVQIYVPLAQHTVDDIFLLVRPQSGPAEALASSARAAIARVDKERLVSVRDVMTLNDVAWEATGRHRFRAVLVVTFAGLALLLAMVGVFGVLAYSVQQRVRDFAVRRALGATSFDVFRLVASWTVRLIVIGTGIGLVLSSVLSRLLSTILFGVEPLDPMTFGAVTVVLAITASLAAIGPAWRAVHIDPAGTLRGE